MLQNSRQDIENTLRTTKELGEQKAEITQELSSETERIKKRTRRKMDEVIREVRQKVKTENIKAESWIKDQSEKLWRRFTIAESSRRDKNTFNNMYVSLFQSGTVSYTSHQQKI